MTIEILNENNFDTETNTGTTLVDFYADWCGPCRMLTPIIESIAEDLQGKASVVKVDVDKSPNLAARFGVRGIPTILVIKDGVVTNRQTGVGNKQQLIELINNNKETL
jgi:thioredoxin 1